MRLPKRTAWFTSKNTSLAGKKLSDREFVASAFRGRDMRRRFCWTPRKMRKRELRAALLVDEVMSRFNPGFSGHSSVE